MIYAMEVGDYVKIGHSEDPAQRVRDLRGSCPLKCTAIGVMNGGYTEESKVHAEFSHIRVKGEWFKKTDELEKWISLNMQPAEDVFPGINRPLGKRAVSHSIKTKLKPGKKDKSLDRQDMDVFLMIALARGEKLTRAAKLSGMSHRTAQRRLEDIEFLCEVGKLRKEVISNVSIELGVAAKEALDALCSLLDSDSITIQLGAARGILETCFGSGVGIDIKKRISRLEEIADLDSEP